MPAVRGSRPHNYRHGHTAGSSRGRAWSATYRTWAGMVQRCTLPSSPRWKYYGGRGITVCDRWRLFDNFLADMGERPEGTTIERVKNELGYEPRNCRWATRTEQAQNRSTTKLTLDTANEALGRLEHGEPIRSVAARLGTSVACIKDLRGGRTWPQIARAA